VFKYGPRLGLLPHVETIMPICRQAFVPGNPLFGNSAVRKLAIYLAQRLGLCCLKPKIASWRYQRGILCFIAKTKQNDQAADRSSKIWLVNRTHRIQHTVVNK
jgi:hypothetical protein